MNDVGGGLMCLSFQFNHAINILTTVMVTEVVVVIALLIRSRRLVAKGLYDHAGALILPLYFWHLLVMVGILFLRSMVLFFLPKNSSSWLWSQIVVLDTLDAYFRDGMTIFLAMKGVGVVQIQQQRALSGLWASMIFIIGLYVAATSDPPHEPYLGAPYWYWQVHDGLTGALHVVLLLCACRPGFSRRKAKSWIFSLFMAIVYAGFSATMVMEVREKGSGDCLSIFTQVFIYTGLPIVAYTALRWDSNFWRTLGMEPPKKRRIPREGDAVPLLHADDLDVSHDEFARHLIDYTHIQRGRMIGEGAAARVYVGTLDGQDVAIKHFKIAGSITPECLKEYIRELSLSLRLKHPNIVTTYGISVIVPNIAIVLEYMSRGSLFRVLRGARRNPRSLLINTDVIFADAQRPVSPGPDAQPELAFMPLDVKLQMCHDVASALAFMHGQVPHPILHLDLKSLNVLVADDWALKLSDFGESRLIQPSGFVTATMGRGTPHWSAPEIIRTTESAYSTKSDVYALGMVMYEILTGKQPFEDVDAWKLGYMIAQEGARPDLPHTGPRAPVSFVSLIALCWSDEIAKRPEAAAVVRALETIQKKMLELGGSD